MLETEVYVIGEYWRGDLVDPTISLTRYTIEDGVKINSGDEEGKTALLIE